MTLPDSLPGLFSALLGRWRRASERTELAVVVGLPVGIAVALSVVALAQRATLTEIPFSNPRILRTIGLEIVFILVLWPLLKQRGWTLARLSLGEPPGGRDLLRGIALWFGMVGSLLVVGLLAAVVAPDGVASLSAFHPVGSLSPIVIGLLIAVNPVFEETLYLGYCGAVLRTRGVSYALSAGLVFRLLVHTYQGPLALFTITPIGLVFGLYYFRTGRLWPAIIAHGIQDLVALSQLVAALPN